MENELRIDLFTALGLEKRAHDQFYLAWEHLRTNTDPNSLPDSRRAFANAVVYYFNAASKLLCADMRISDPQAMEPIQGENTVFSSFLAIICQHRAIMGKSAVVVVSTDEEKLLKETEVRLGKLVSQNISDDFTVTAEEIQRLIRAIWILDRVVRS